MPVPTEELVLYFQGQEKEWEVKLHRKSGVILIYEAGTDMGSSKPDVSVVSGGRWDRC